MSVPTSEKDIVQILNLEMYAKQHPVPEFNEYLEYITVLDGNDYTEQAIQEAVNALSAVVLQELLQYPKRIFNHNNIGGHGGAAGSLTIAQILGVSLKP